MNFGLQYKEAEKEFMQNAGQTDFTLESIMDPYEKADYEALPLPDRFRMHFLSQGILSGSQFRAFSNAFLHTPVNEASLEHCFCYSSVGVKDVDGRIRSFDTDFLFTRQMVWDKTETPGPSAPRFFGVSPDALFKALVDEAGIIGPLYEVGFFLPDDVIALRHCTTVLLFTADRRHYHFCHANGKILDFNGFCTIPKEDRKMDLAPAYPLSDRDIAEFLVRRV